MRLLTRGASLALICLLFATPAAAHIESVLAPSAVDTGAPFTVVVNGYMPDSCWEQLGQSWDIAGMVLTLHITTADVGPPGVACLLVIVPYEVTEQLTVQTPGAWTLRVVEHRTDPDHPGLPDLVHEQGFTACGPVAVEVTTWGALRARYR